MDEQIIVDAMKSIVTGTGQTVSADQEAQMRTLAVAIKTMVQGATITYTTGLVAPGGGGPVTGVFGGSIS